MVQRRAARYVCNNYIQMASVTGLLQRLGWRSLQQRRTDIRLVFLYKCMNGLVAGDLSDLLVRQTRPSRHCNSMTYHVPVATKTYVQKGFLPHTLNQWNRLPEHIVQSASLDAIKEGASGITYWFPSLPNLSLYFLLLHSTNNLHPLSSFLSLLYPLFFSLFLYTYFTKHTHTHTRANKPHREGWLVLQRKKKNRNVKGPSNMVTIPRPKYHFQWSKYKDFISEQLFTVELKYVLMLYVHDLLFSSWSYALLTSPIWQMTRFRTISSTYLWCKFIDNDICLSFCHIVYIVSHTEWQDHTT